MKLRFIHVLLVATGSAVGCSLSHSPDLPIGGDGDGDFVGDGDFGDGDMTGDGDGDGDMGGAAPGQGTLGGMGGAQ